MGFKTPITIAEVINHIRAGDYVLPAIQREFVWSSDQIEKLFDSLMRGYPIGSFLFWQVHPDNLNEFQFYRFIDFYHQRDHKHNTPIDLKGRPSPVIAVLDGQQRLSGLNIGLRGWYAAKLPYHHWNSDHAFPRRHLYLNLVGPVEDDMEFRYEFRLLRDRDLKEGGHGKHWFLVGNILNFKDYQETFDYCIEHNLVQGGNKFPHHTLGDLFRVIKEKPLIQYFQEEEQDLDKVLNIFIRVNSGGTILSYSDMLLSIATAQWQEKDARREIYGLVDDLNEVGEGFSFNKDFVLKASLVLSDLPAIEFRVDSFNRTSMHAIEAQWDHIRRALLMTAKLLASWGYSQQTLVSNNAAIPLAYYLHKRGCPANFVESQHHEADRAAMRRWLAIALLKRTFSGQSDSTLRSVRRASQGQNGAFPDRPIHDELRGTGKSMVFDDAELDGLLAYQYHQSHTFTVLALLYPWLKYDQHFHVDHIFPRALFNEKELAARGIPRDQWPAWLDRKDDLANLQLLQGLPNQEKSDQEFEAWLMGKNPSVQDLTAYRQLHSIPDVPLSFENFPNFLRAREALIKTHLQQLLRPTA